MIAAAAATAAAATTGTGRNAAAGAFATTAALPEDSPDYVWRVNDNHFIDARSPELSNWCRYVNHADEPWTNVAVRPAPLYILNGGVSLFALRDVARGEELLCDYGPSYWEGREAEVREPSREPAAAAAGVGDGPGG